MTGASQGAVVMSTMVRSDNVRWCLRRGLGLLCASALVLASMTSRPAAQGAGQRTFASPEEAVKALIATVKAGNLEQLLTLFGTDGREFIASADPAIAKENRQVFTVAAGEQWHLEDAGPNRKTLVIGNEDWPFPIPLARGSSGWRFDTAAGKEELLARRIGRNELSAIETCRAYVSAQQRYAQQGRGGKAAGVYAMKFLSDPGTENGLYWPVKKGQPRSPLGELVAQAAVDAHTSGAKQGQPSPLHGYYFKILTAQGAAAKGGARNYIVKGEMSGGFALIAWPSKYDGTGVMTFLVNQDGVVYEKDLGPGTDAAARTITVYNPDASWRQVR